MPELITCGVYPYSGDTNYTLSLTANRLDEAGNTLSTARNIGILRGNVSFQDFVGNADTNDYYRFSVTNTSTFRLALSDLSADADVELLNSSGELIQSSTASGSTAESINLTLNAGIYYVRVYPYNPSETNYDLSLTAIPPDRVGNRLGAARNLGMFRGSFAFQDFVGSTDTFDYYRFSVRNTSNVRLSLSGLSADADVQLLNRAGGVVQSSTAGSSTAESINRTLSARIYYVRVYPYNSSDTNYNPSLSATPVVRTPDGAGNTLGTARNAGILNRRRTFRDFVGSNDPNDYYRVALARNSNFSLTLNGLNADADVQLLNRNGGVIQSSTASGATSESIRSVLNTGVYYVRVYPYSGNTNYNLALSATAAPVDGAGNSLAAARNLGVLNGNRSFQDFVGRIDTNDYYRFSLNRTSDFRLTLNRLSVDADVQLLDSSGEIIQGSYAEGSLPESINRTLNASTYYLRVYPYSGNTNYNLSLVAAAATQLDGAGNTLGSARNLGTLSSSRLFRDFVGTSDTDDYYLFNLEQSSNFRLVLNGLTADADVELLNSVGEVVQSSTLSGSSPELIDRQLNAGTYYVRIYPFNNSNTNYDLLLSGTPTTSVFNPIYGYGLVNAAAAVARAVGQAPLSDVTNLGGNNWGNDLVNAPEVWARGYTGGDVVVAVIDTGVDYGHTDLNDNVWVNAGEVACNGIDDDRNGYIDDVRGWDFIGRDNNPTDEDGHGTHVAGTISGENNTFGVTGVAYNARIMPVRVLSSILRLQPSR
ncbi:pre-peptidase C-terminal domain-containing protein [Cyanobacteria bacterium FACHB-471]|nr:pre-peptidase C-terminal domain-containing protein [Cyanobacteria bacterium FACHB-471]